MDINQKVFETIYDGFAPKIFKFCYFRVSSKEEAEDIASQVFLRAWDHVASGKKVANFPAFLYKIANNLIIDFYRKNRDGREFSMDDPATRIDVVDDAEFIGKLDVRLAIAEIRQKLSRLPESYREVMIMRYVSDLSVKEMAEVLGISENNISVRLYRAMEKFKTLC